MATNILINNKFETRTLNGSSLQSTLKIVLKRWVKGGIIISCFKWLIIFYDNIKNNYTIARSAEIYKVSIKILIEHLLKCDKCATMADEYLERKYE